MKKNNKQSPKFFISLILVLFSYVYSTACTCPPETTCATSPNFSITVCNVDIIEVTFFGYTTFGSSPGEFCACGFNMPSQITEVLSVSIVDSLSNVELSAFSFAQNSTTATEFDNLMSGDWEGFSSSVSGTINAGISIKIIYTVRVTDCTTTTLQNAIAGLNAIGTGGATAGGVPNDHVCIPPPPLLPVELSNLTGDSDGTDIRLSWKTLSETNSDYFAIERSPNGKSFKEIGVIQGAGNSFSSTEYNYVDKTPAAGVNYYRLKQVDLDGTFRYSEIVSVESVLKKPTLILFPNPVHNGELNLFLPNTDNGEKLVEVYNCLGNLMFAQTFQTNRTQMQLSSLSQGVYMISVKINGTTFWEKVVVN